MNAIQFALNEIQEEIPPEILHEAFIAPLTKQDHWGRVHAPVLSVEHMIRDKVIEKRVIPRLSVVSGQRDHISLEGLPIEYEKDYTQTIHIPKARTKGLSITAVFGIISGSAYGSVTGMSNVSQQRGNGVTEALSAMRMSRASVPVVADTHIQLIADNTVLLRAPLRQYGYLFLDCLLEHDRMMGNIGVGSWELFTEICLLATKAWIKNNMVVPMDQAQISGGMALGAFRNEIDEYRDANVLLKEKIADWRVVNVLADPLSFDEHITGVVGGLFP
jgi:hypothetical protein